MVKFSTHLKQKLLKQNTHKRNKDKVALKINAIKTS